MAINLITVAAAAVSLTVVAGSADTSEIGRLDPLKAVAKSEQAIGHRVGSYILSESTGASLPLGSYRGKPLVISLVYSACSSICPPTTQRLIAAVREAGRMLGSDRFEVLTVGFDARNDTPSRLAQFAAVQGVAFPNWRLASADPGTLDALLRDLGFSYVAAAGGFDHVAQTTILDGDGRVYRQVYGDDFPIQMFIEPLKDLVYGTNTSLRLSGMLDRIRFICTTYDPGLRRYRIDYGLVFGGMIAGMSLLVFGGILVREWRRTARA
jgi:protein SCO1/2